MRMLKMCLNWKALAGLAVLGLGIYAIAPNLAAAALPILLLAICPLSMMFMMKSMGGTQEQQTLGEADGGLTREERLARLRTEQVELAEQIETLERNPVAGGQIHTAKINRTPEPGA